MEKTKTCKNCNSVNINNFCSDCGQKVYDKRFTIKSFIMDLLAAYLYWELVWASGGKPLVELSGHTYILTDYYWAFRQYSKFIYRGWKRITALSDDTELLISAYTNPGETKCTVVIINRSPSASKQMALTIQNFDITDILGIRTSDTDKGVEFSVNQSDLTALEFPAHSITTLDISGESTSSMELKKSLPNIFILKQNCPNPFNPVTTIEFFIPRQQTVRIDIYDIKGKFIETLLNKQKSAGTHKIQWNASRMPSGVYLFKIETENFIAINKGILLK